jgi:hypothetical protein
LSSHNFTVTAIGSCVKWPLLSIVRVDPEKVRGLFKNEHQKDTCLIKIWEYMIKIYKQVDATTIANTL